MFQMNGIGQNTYNNHHIQTEYQVPISFFIRIKCLRKILRLSFVLLNFQLLHSVRCYNWHKGHAFRKIKIHVQSKVAKSVETFCGRHYPLLVMPVSTYPGETNLKGYFDTVAIRSYTLTKFQKYINICCTMHYAPVWG